MKKIFLTIFFIYISLSNSTLLRAEEFGDWYSETSFMESGEDNYAEEADDPNISTAALQGRVVINDEYLDGDLLKISVVAEDFRTPVVGIAFHLKYEDQLVTFLKYEPGEYLESGGDPFYMVQNDETGSKIIFGETLRGDDQFPLGEGKIADFYFQILNEQAIPFEFSKGVISTIEVIRQDIDHVEWKNLISSRLTDDQLVFSSQDGVLGANISKKILKKLSFYSPILWLTSGIFIASAYLLIHQKYRKKRPMPYVNFK